MNIFNQLSKKIFIFFFVVPGINWAAHEAEPPHLGYYALPFSQQPGPLVTFGQSLIEAKHKQVFLFPSYAKIENGKYFDIYAGYVYGISDNTALELSLPYDFDNVNGSSHSSGLGDFNLQLEHAFYSRSNVRFQDTATFVSSLYLPSGSVKKSPATGFGAPAFFEGITLNRTYTYWSYSLSTGAIITTSNDGFQWGSSFLYQGSIGFILFSKPKQYTSAFLVEFTGQWTDKNRFHGVADPNTGGNTIFITPSWEYSGQKFFFQIGVSIPLLQQYKGVQFKYHYNPVALVGYTWD